MDQKDAAVGVAAAWAMKTATTIAKDRVIVLIFCNSLMRLRYERIRQRQVAVEAELLDQCPSGGL